MEIVIAKLIIAHLLGDFFLQPDSWVKEKEHLKLKSGKLYLHIFIHFVLIVLLLGSLDIWPLACMIGISHFIIDGCKLLFQTEKTKRLWFFTDQFLHLLCIFYCVLWFYGGGLPDLSFLSYGNGWIYICGALFLTSPTAIVIKVVISKFLPENNSASLQNAGKFIGVLERLLIYIFILTGHFEAVGFLLAAKSIFRFGDLKEAKEVRLTEYVLIGTLLSFGIATGVALSVVSFVF